jgi:PAS domain S-box-containing protein
MRGFRRISRLRIEFRMMTSLVTLVAIVIVLVVVLVDFRQRAVMMNLNQERGLAIGNSLAAASSSALLSYNYVTLQQMTQRAAGEEGMLHVIVLDKERRVAGYSNRPEWQGRELFDPVSQAATGLLEPLIQRVPPQVPGGNPSLDIAVPVYVEGSPKPWGLVRVGLSLDHMYEELASTRRLVLSLGLAVLVLAALGARLLARRITGPLNRLVEATGELAKGNFDYRVELHTGDEIEDLSRQFDTMAREICQKQSEVASTNQELASLNARLEEKVLERTRALTEAEEKYRLLVEQSPNAICIIQGGRLVFFNHAFPETFRYTPEQLNAQDFHLLDLVEPEQHEFVRDLMKRSLNGTASSSCEIFGRDQRGNRVYLDMHYTGISYEGEPALEAILVDVTEQRQLQEKMVSSERLRALGEMASGVAHDFNNVLGAILARAQLLARGVEDGDVLRGLHIIEKAAQDGAATVQRIQEFTRLRTDRDFRPVNLNTVLEDVLEMTRGRWADEAQRQGKRVDISRAYSQIPDVAGNISELREVFTNLVLNAVDAIPGEGQITVCSYEEAGSVVVTVSDTGEGMSAEVKRRLFDPFFTTKGEKGNGLGMSIVYGIVRRHGGEITFMSEPNEGTMFQVTLPGLAEKAAKSPALATETLLVGCGRVLVVDDDDDIRTLVADILAAAGYEVEMAAGGAEAVDQVRSKTFDLVVSDLGMPDVTGWDVARESRAAQPGLRFILLTGWGATLDPEEVKRHAIDRTLKKPFEMNDLLRAVSDVLRTVGVKRAA